MASGNGKFYCLGEQVVLGFGGETLTRLPFSFFFPKGALTALIGPNGSGKTTLLRAILGEPVLLSGNIFLFDFELNTRRASPLELSRSLAFVPQEHLYPSESTLNNLLRLAYLPRMGLFGRVPMNSSDEIDQLLSLFSMEKLKARPLKYLSTGERQKAFLGRALLQRPRLLVLDEPTNHLDPGAIHGFWQLLLERRKSSSLDVLLSTHDLSFVRQHCDWICALKEGQLFYDGPSREFFRSNKANELFGLPMPVRKESAINAAV